MKHYPWAHEFPGAVTISDVHGILHEMNEKAAESFAKEIDLPGSMVQPRTVCRLR